MSGPEVDSTILSLLRGPAPCPICGSALPAWCDHRKRARWCVDGTDGPECGECEAVLDLRQEHVCSNGRRENLNSSRPSASVEMGDDRERLGRDIEARAIASWLRHQANGRDCSATKARYLREFALSIESREHDR